MGDPKFTKGPWTVDGPPWNQIVWSSAENRVCFLAHSNGADDERDIATGRLIAAAPALFEAVMATEAAERARVGGPDWKGGQNWVDLDTHATALRRAALSAAAGRG